jgi:two-component system, OmpR family, sensor histidine kinase QseC
LKPHSTSAVLLGGSIAVLLAVLGAAAWIGYDGSEDEADELFDARLATSARVLAALVATQPAGDAAAPIVVSFPAPLEAAAHDEAGPLGHHYETKIAFQVLDAQGRLLMRSASAPAAAYAPLAAGFSTQRHAGRDWRVFSLRSGERWVQAAERDDVRGELSGKLALAAVAPLIAGIPLLLLLLGLLVRYGLAPLAELARRIEGRRPDSLARVELARTTAEIAPVVQALNGLLERVRSALERERRFTADAAHELRTPLAALKIHAQNAARASSDAERRSSLERMLHGLERSTRLVEQMLALSRAAAARASAVESVSLRQALEDALDDALPALRERGIKLNVVTDPPVADFTLRGERDKLTCLARNLLDNAARHAPPGSSVKAELVSRDGVITLAVCDQGAGIPHELRERVFESYYRIPGTAGPGSGLGLAIVREIAAQHDGVVEITDGDGGCGTRVSVTFPGARR